MSTTPGCAYIGGHRDGFDPECAWCHDARSLPSSTPAETSYIDVDPETGQVTAYGFSAPSEQLYSFQENPEPHPVGELTIARRGPTPRCGECYGVGGHGPGCSRDQHGWPSATVDLESP